jgi:hypothetical protein
MLSPGETLIFLAPFFLRGNCWGKNLVEKYLDGPEETYDWLKGSDGR